LPAEEVFDAVAELIGACSAKRAAAQFATASSRSSAELVPGWDEMIARAAGHALNGR
jgi:hypothetical protein